MICLIINYNETNKKYYSLISPWIYGILRMVKSFQRISILPFKVSISRWAPNTNLRSNFGRTANGELVEHSHPDSDIDMFILIWTWSWTWTSPPRVPARSAGCRSVGVKLGEIELQCVPNIALSDKHITDIMKISISKVIIWNLRCSIIIWTWVIRTGNTLYTFLPYGDRRGRRRIINQSPANYNLINIISTSAPDKKLLFPRLVVELAVSNVGLQPPLPSVLARPLARWWACVSPMDR